MIPNTARTLRLVAAMIVMCGSSETSHGSDSLLDAQVLLANGIDQAAGHRFAHSVPISGRYAAIGAPGDPGVAAEGGAVYLFERNDADTWQQVTKLLPSGPAIGGLSRTYGGAVALSGGTLVVGPAIRSNNTVSGARAVDVYERDGSGQWGFVTTLTGSDPNDGLSQWGRAVAVDGRRIIVGDPKGFDTSFDRVDPGVAVEGSSRS